MLSKKSLKEKLLSIAALSPSEEINLCKGNSGQALFLFYLNWYMPNKKNEAKAVAFSKQIYMVYKQNRHKLVLYNGILDGVSMFHNLYKYNIADTDVHSSFQEIEKALFNELNTKNITNLGNNEGVLCVLFFLYSRFHDADINQLNIEKMRQLESLILAIDELEKVVALQNENINELGNSLMLLALIKAKKIYPEIVSRIYAYIKEQLIQYLKKKPRDFNSLYSLWRGSLILGEDNDATFYLNKIYELEEADIFSISLRELTLEEIKAMQQCNRLYWHTKDNHLKYSLITALKRC